MRLLLSSFCLLLLLLPVLHAQNQQVTLSGYLTDAESGEALIGGAVFIPSTGQGTLTNEYGFYSLTIPAGTYVVQFQYLGYLSMRDSLVLDRDLTLNRNLKLEGSEMEAVEIVAEDYEEQETVNSTQMSTIRMPIEQIKRIPAIGGEVDIIKAVQLMPGVAQGGEGGTGMFVRGGDADQNLVLIDEAPVYNLSHLFGFFSVFNPDALKDVTIIKGGFPAQYGGRLSAVLDVRQKEGNINEFHAQGGIGLLSSRLTIEGPILKDKMSFMISGRRTYIDQVFKLVGTDLPYYFYDLNAKINYKIGQNDRLFFSSYFGNDVLKFDENVPAEDDSSDTNPLDFGFILGNWTQTLRWNHLYTNKLFSNISLIHTTFRYDIRGNFLDNSILIKSRIRDLGMKADFDYFRDEKTHIRYGLHFTTHLFRPNVVSTKGVITEYLESQEGDLLAGHEWALYGNYEKDLSTRWKLNGGLRLSGIFTEGKTYGGIEPRFSARYRIDENNSIKFAYSRMYQYMHRVSSSSIALPTDLWYPVTENVQPQYADQVAAGWTHLVPDWKGLLEVEAFYKYMNKLIEYREGANLILNDDFEAELVSGHGQAWGLEVLFRKNHGKKLTGWVGYTLSFANRQFDELNDGEQFWAKYDRRHDFSLVGILKLGKRWDFSWVTVFSSGARFTAMTGQYFMPNASLTGVDVIPIYSKRNEVRMSPTARVDVNFIYKSREIRKNGKKKKYQWELHMGAYNFFNRATPYRIEVIWTENGYKYVQPGLFGFIPSVAYNFKF